MENSPTLMDRGEPPINGPYDCNTLKQLYANRAETTPVQFDKTSRCCLEKEAHVRKSPTSVYKWNAIRPVDTTGPAFKSISLNVLIKYA